MQKETKDIEQVTEEEKSDWKSDLIWMAKAVVIVAIVAFLMTRFVIVNAVVPTGSMQNTIMSGSRVFGSRLSYHFSEPERGDIIVFKYPVDEKKLYIKRLIGLPGEIVEIKDGKIYIDDSDTPLEEAYLPEEWTVGNDGYTFVVPEDSYLMLGDNRNSSVDARYWALEAINNGVATTTEDALTYTYVTRDQVVAKAMVVYWPLTQMQILD